MVRVWVWVLAGLLGCNSGDRTEPQPTPPSEETPKPVAPAQADPPTAATPEPPTCDRTKITTCFGKLTHFAGRGKREERGRNGWDPLFEGGKATEAELSRPHFAMADAAGNVYINDKEAHAVRKVDTAGIITTIAGTGRAGDDGDEPRPALGSALNRPNSVWVKPDGTVFVLDLGNDKVRRIGTDGVMTTLVTIRQGISIGRGLWVSPDERTAYVGSGRAIWRWHATEGLSRIARGFRILGTLAVDSDGTIVVADRGTSRVYRVDADGNKTVVAGNGKRRGDVVRGALAVDSPLPGVRTVWLDGHGGMFLGTHESSRVWYVGADGRLQPMFVDQGISEVRGISVDGRGRFILVEHDGGIVRVAEPGR